MKEYKIFLYAENAVASIFLNGGKVDPIRLTQALNQQATQGWEVKALQRENRRTALFFSREAFIFVLERNK